MKLSWIIIGVLALSGLFVYLSQDWEETPALIDSQIASRTPSEVALSTAAEGQAATAASTVTPTPSDAPLSGESTKPVNSSFIALPVSREFDAVFGSSADARSLHIKLEQQPRDPIWAPETETAYRNWVQGKTDLLRYGIRTEVDCRTNMCELRLLAYGGEQSSELYGLLVKQPGSFSLPDGGTTLLVDGDHQDGVTTIIIQTAFPKRPGFSIK
jgi:hypothetical protein